MKLKEFGDFQTPIALVKAIIIAIKRIGIKWERVLEPTCGRGNFIRGIIEFDNFTKEIIGLELQKKYFEYLNRIDVPENVNLKIIETDIFNIDLKEVINLKNKVNLLVIGNPPWVTSSTMGVIDGKNLPKKVNLKGLKGIEALTGNSNFDITEYIWIKLITELADVNATISLLCKTSVARNVLRYAYQIRLGIKKAYIHKIDAKKWFKAIVDACLFTVQLEKNSYNYRAEVFDSLSEYRAKNIIGFKNNYLISNIDKYKELDFIDGKSPIQWRQGIKHDAAKVMELSFNNGSWYNKLEEIVDVEDEYIYPLMKSSDLRPHIGTKQMRSVIIPQKSIGQDTGYLKNKAPKLWNYLSSHSGIFLSRKSSIYKGKSKYAIFGIGEYSFSPYKVMVSGLYKNPYFMAVSPKNGKPVMCDDTSYLLSVKSASHAAIIVAVLNHPVNLKFIDSITFWDSKRPITKTLLNRINLIALIKHISVDEIKRKAKEILAQDSESNYFRYGINNNSELLLNHSGNIISLLEEISNLIDNRDFQ